MKKSHFIVPALFTLAAGFATAQDYKDFDEVDLNSDGQLSSQELRTAIPALETMMSASGAAGASASGAAGAAAGSATVSREQISRALPGIEFDEERGPIDEDAYDAIVEHLEERGMSTTSSSSPAGATGAANQSDRGAAQSGANSNSPRATQSSPGQTSGAPGQTRPNQQTPARQGQ